MDFLVYVVAPLVIFAGLALKFGRDSRPGFDHREVRDEGPPNV